ncbi:MAG: carboxymuconolactone decarboxylase family protein [Caulobacteraceae bacterium]
MARIPYFDPAKAVGRAAAAYEKLPPLNIFRMMGHAGELIDGFTRLGTQILNFTSLDPVLREIAIVRVGVLSGATYEVFQHERIARRIGLSDALIGAIHEGPGAAAFDEVQRQVMAFTDDVVANVRAADATFEPLKEALGYKALQELTLTIGYYMLVSRFLETFDVDIEAGEPPAVTVSTTKG